MSKKCPQCLGYRTKKFGIKRGKQRWKCNECHYVFCNASRPGKQKNLQAFEVV